MMNPEDSKPLKLKTFTNASPKREGDVILHMDPPLLNEALYFLKLGVHGNYVGAPMGRAQVEYELKSPRSVYRNYCLYALANYIESWVAARSLLYTRQVLLILRRQLQQLADWGQSTKDDQRRQQFVRDVKAVNFNFRSALLPYYQFNPIELNWLIDATVEEIETALERFEAYDRKIMHYSIDVIRQLKTDTATIKEEIATDNIIAAAAPEDVAETKQILDEWQEVNEMHERNDERLLEQADVAQVLEHVPEVVREAKRNVNHELNRNLLKKMFDRKNITNPVVDKLDGIFKQQDDVLLKSHAQKGLRQFKFKGDQTAQVAAKTMVEKIQQAPLSLPQLEVLAAQGAEQLEQAAVKVNVEQTLLINDVFTALTNRQDDEKSFKDLLHCINEGIDKFTSSLSEEPLTEQEKEQLDCVSKLYEKIESLKKEGITADSTKALLIDLQEGIKPLSESQPECQLYKALSATAALPKFQPSSHLSLKRC